MSMVEDGLSDSKSEDYMPGYLSTNRGFDPHTASFFYESGGSATATASTTSSHHTLAKVEDSEQQPSKLFAIKEEDEETSTFPHRVPSGDYLAAQRQYQKNLLQRQQYLLRSGELQQMAEPDGIARSQYSSRFVQFATSAPGNNYPHSDAYQQPNAAAASIQCPPQMIMASHYPPGMQSAGPCMVQHMPGGTGTQYAGGPLRYMPREEELQTPVFISSQGQVTAVPPGTIVYMQDGRSLPIQTGQFAYTTFPLEYVQRAPVTCDSSVDLGTGVTKEEPVDTIGEQTAVTDRRKKRRLKRDKTVEGEDAAINVVTKKRGRKRKKVESVAGAENKQQTNAASGQPYRLSHGELLKQKKKNMAFPKGTFLVRYADLDNEEYAGHIWLVDNHQLLQKYTYDGLDAYNVKVFSRTERYSGWLCTCPWLYHPLSNVKGIFGNMEKVAITNYPTREELFARREKELFKAKPPQAEQEPTKESHPAEEVTQSEADHSEDELDRETQQNEEAEVSHLFKSNPI